MLEILNIINTFYRLRWPKWRQPPNVTENRRNSCNAVTQTVRVPATANHFLADDHLMAKHLLRGGNHGQKGR